MDSKINRRRGCCPMNRGLKFTKVGVIAFIHVVLTSSATTEARAADSNYELKPISLPGATGAVALDYFACDPATGKVWLPASNLGSVDVIDEKLTRCRRLRGSRPAKSSGVDEK